ncbi:MAG: hypothetical protein K9G58_14865 [Bacteroidales bacterium]|nr:hypothetical protein [Bacteroidales bacterium]
MFRNEILINNKGTEDEGLTFLDHKTLSSVFRNSEEIMGYYKINNPKELSKEFNLQRFHIAKIKEGIWNFIIEEKGKEIKNKRWSSDFHKAYSSNTSEKERSLLLKNNDFLTKLALIWGTSNSNQKNLLEEITQRERGSRSWEIQASLTTSPHCNSKYLHHVAESLGNELGFGYILRIISRNPNVKKETLEMIAKDLQVDERYSQCAKSALENGKESANHQI